MIIHTAAKLAVIPAVICLSACSGAGNASGSFVVRDSAGIRITLSAEPAWYGGSGWCVADAPMTEIGLVEGDSNYQLYRVRGAVRLETGVIVIANSGTRELRFYDEEGHHIRTAGRSGSGPGEFEMLSWLGRYGGDSLVVWDSRNRRISVFDRDGTFVRSTQLNARGAVSAVFADGSFLIEEMVHAGTNGLLRHKSVVWRFPGVGGTPDSLGVFRGYEQIVSSQQVGSGFRISESSRPFGRRAVFAASGNGFVAGTQDQFELLRYSQTGSLISIVRLARDNAPVTAEDVEAFKERSMGNLVRGDPETHRRKLDGLPYPEMMPAYGEILIDDEGYLWVQEYGLPGVDLPRWVVFDTQDRMLGTVETPTGLTIYQIGRDFLLGVARDQLDIEYVRLYGLFKD